MQNQKFQDMTWIERIDLIRALSLFPAITVMVFIRRKIGFRLLKPTWLIVLTLSMLFVCFGFKALAKPFGFVMAIFALAMLGLGLLQRWQRWKELCSGKRWHTFSPGISYLESLPLPAFFKTDRRVNRFLDPAVVFLIGLTTTALVSHALGLWLTFSAFFLYVYEQNLYEKQLARDLDTLDGLFESEVQAEVVGRFAGSQTSEASQQTLEETAGIPTGLAPDIQKQIALKQAKRNARPGNVFA